MATHHPRPSFPAPDPENIFITDGASPAIKTVLELLIKDESDEILIPIPQYPLYSASITRLGGKWVGYELSENYDVPNQSWGLDLGLIEEKMASGKVKGVVVWKPPHCGCFGQFLRRGVCTGRGGMATI